MPTSSRWSGIPPTPTTWANWWPPIRGAAAFLAVAAMAGAATVAAWMLSATLAGPRGPAAAGRPLAIVTQTRFLLPAEGERPLAIGQPLDAGRITLAHALDAADIAAMQAGADDFMPKSKFPQLIRPLITRLVPQF